MIVKSECPRCGLEDSEASKYATLNNDRTAHVVCEGCGCLFYSSVEGNHRMEIFSEVEEADIEKLIHDLISIDRDDARIALLEMISYDTMRKWIKLDASARILSRMFIWKRTPQGHSYWYNVHIELERSLSDAHKP